MKQARKPSTLRRDTRGYWYSQWRDANGKRHTKTFGKIEGEAVFAYQQWVGQWFGMAEVRNPTTKAHTINALANAYQCYADGRYVRPDGTPTGEGANVRVALKDFRAMFGGKDAAKLTPADIRAYRAGLVGRGLTRQGAEKYTNLVKRFIAWAELEGHIPVEVSARCCKVEVMRPGEGGAREADGVDAAPEEHIAKAKEHLPQVVRDMIDVLLLTGARVGEVCNMQPVLIDITREPWLYQPGRHKNAWRGKRRVVLLGPQARRIIQPYLDRPLHDHLFDPNEAARQRNRAKCDAYQMPEGAQGDYRTWASYKARRDAASGRRYRGHYTTQTLGQAIRYACDAAGVAVWSPGQLRHNAAQRIERIEIERGAAPDQARNIARLALGHGRIETTGIYAAREQADVGDFVERAG